jgi:hypothetical protein
LKGDLWAEKMALVNWASCSTGQRAMGRATPRLCRLSLGRRVKVAHVTRLST